MSDKLTLLLVGRTGNGKSSIGNTIIGRKAFKQTMSSEPLNDDIEAADSCFDDEVTVVDGPGIGDASFDNYEDIESTLKQVEKALVLCAGGFSALLIVLKYGIRFTKQEKDAITMIKAIFGPDVVRKYGVIVMSHGDSFELDTEDEELSFEDWCKEQTGDVKALFTECDNRCVLFNNRTKDPEKLKPQYHSLMSKVDSVRDQNQNKNYTLAQYEGAEIGRKKLLVQGKLLQIEEKTTTDLDHISHKLDKLGRSTGNNEEFQKKLEDCSEEMGNLKTYLHDEDEGTGCTEELQMRVKLVEMRIQAKLKMLETTKQNPEMAVNQDKSHFISQLPTQKETAMVQSNNQGSYTEITWSYITTFTNAPLAIYNWCFQGSSKSPGSQETKYAEQCQENIPVEAGMDGSYIMVDTQPSNYKDNSHF